MSYNENHHYLYNYFAFNQIGLLTALHQPEQKSMPDDGVALIRCDHNWLSAPNASHPPL